MMLQGAPQPSLRALGRLRLESVGRRETTLETDRLRRHPGDFQTEQPKARVFPETPKPHRASPGDAPQRHNLSIDPYDYLMINPRKPAHDSFGRDRTRAHAPEVEGFHPRSCDGGVGSPVHPRPVSQGPPTIPDGGLSPVRC